MSTFMWDASAGPWRVEDPLEREPKLIRTLRQVDPRGDTAYLLPAREVFKVDWFEPDRRGVSVTSPAGCSVSLHPSEFEVLKWADEPKESS